MKKLFVLISMMSIIIGMTLPAFSGSPGKDKGEKSKVELTPLPTPLTTWTLDVYIDDADVDCPAQECSLVIYVFGAGDNCIPVSSTVLGSATYIPGTSLYQFGGSTNYTYAYIVIYDTGNPCDYNKNTCCEPIGTGMVCHLNVCEP